MPVSHALLLRLSARALLAAGALAAAGCATVTRESTQRVSIVAVDADDQPLSGMRCRVFNGLAVYYGDSPMHDVPVHRSFSDLEIVCRRGVLVARGTAVARGSGSLVQAMLPGGTALMAVDLVSGRYFSYPVEIRVRAGEHLVFDPARTRGSAAIEPAHLP